MRQDLIIRQGETWSYEFIHVDSDGSAIDLTGYSARMAIKAGYQSANESYLSTGSDADGGSIALGGANGKVTLSMTADESARLAGDLSYFVFVKPEAAVEPRVTFGYDLELVDGAGAVTRVLEGRVVVLREYTS